MKSWLWAVVPALLLFEADAYAGGGTPCVDACVSLLGNPSCVSQGGLGCFIPNGQATAECGRCSQNTHCAPFGTCIGGTCINTICGLDGGAPDALPTDSGPPGDTGPQDIGPDGGGGGGDGGGDGGDGGGTDVDPSDGPGNLDALSQPDAVFVPTPGGGGGGRPPPELPPKDKDCGCSTTSGEPASMWSLLGLGVLLLRRRR